MLPQLLAFVLTVAVPIVAHAVDRGTGREHGGGTQPPSAAPDILAQSNSLSEQAVALYKQGRYADAEPLFEEALAIREKALGPDDADVVTSLSNLAGLYRERGRYGEAESLYRRALAIREKAIGHDSPALASSLNNLAALFSNEGRYSDAEPLFQRALALKEKTSGPDDPDVARTLNNLAQLYRLQGRYSQAEPLCKRALAILKKVLGPDHPDVATGLNNLAQLYWAQGRYAEAEPLYLRALALREKAFGPQHPAVASSLNNLGELYRAQDRYGEAEPLCRRALAMREEMLGSDHPDVAASLYNLAALYEAQGRYSEAEPLYRRALGIREKALGPDHPDVAASLTKLAVFYETEGRPGELELIYLRALAIRQRAFGPDHPAVVESLNNLAFLYDALGRYDEAEPLFRRVVTTMEKTLGPENADLATSLNNMAVLLSHQARYGEAEPLYRRALALKEKALGPDHPDIARALNNLAAVSRAQRHDNVAEPLYRRALAIREKALGPDHPDVATSLTNLGALKAAQGRYDEAQQLYTRALAIREKVFGPDSRAVAVSANNLAELYRAENQIEAALASSSRAVGILAKQYTADITQSGGGSPTERRRDRDYFVNHVRIAYAAAARTPQKAAAVAAETFRDVQLAQASSAAKTLTSIEAHFAAGGDDLAAAVRERREVAGRIRQLDADIVKTASRSPAESNPATLQALRAAAEETAQRLNVLDARITSEFPRYAELTGLKPVSAEAVQALVAADEALLVYLSASNETWLWVVRRDAIAFYRLGIDKEALTDEVMALRPRPDPTQNSRLQPYPATRAYQLYEKVLSPTAPLLADVRHLLIVPDGPLRSLPPGVLVTKPPKRDPSDAAEYRDIAWLGREYAISILPSISSLGAFRQFPAPPTASAPFLGIGDPVRRELSAKPRVASLDTRNDARGREKLLASLGTAEELRAVAKVLGASDDNLLFGERASEAGIRQMPLDSYKVIEFATPVRLADSLKDGAEPALALTSAGADQENDGLLTVSKIAGLKLNADWVVLSVCNTAADGSPHAEGLAGLAEAFFYAGAHSLIVSHWRAPPAGAVKFTTGIFAEFAKRPALGRAEAMRHSILDMLDPSSPPELADPAVWAAFALIGEGGAAR